MAVAFSRKRLLAQIFDDDENVHITKYTKFTWFVEDDDVDAFHESVNGDEFAEIDDFAELAAAIANYQMECDDKIGDEMDDDTGDDTGDETGDDKMDDVEYMDIIHKEEYILNDLSKFIIW
jgi:hypothetical protein